MIVYTSHTQLCAHCPSCVHIVLNAHRYIPKSCLHACQQYHWCSGPYSQGVKRAGSVHLHSYGLHICLFFSWRCTTRPWRAMKVMLVVQRWKCVRGGRLWGPARNLQSPHRVPGRGPAPVQCNSRAEERARAHWKHTVHQHVALKPHRYYFTVLQPTFSGCIHTSIHEPCFSKMSTFHELCDRVFFR